MELTFDGKLIKGDTDKNGVAVTKTYSGEVNPQELWIALLNQGATSSITEQTSMDIEHFFKDIADKLEANWRHKYGHKMAQDKKKTLEQAFLNNVTAQIKRVIYNVVADWEQGQINHAGYTWYQKNLSPDVEIDCPNFALLLTDDQQLAVVQKLHDQHLRAAETGNDSNGQPFTKDTYFHFLFIENGLIQDLEDLFATLEGERLRLMLRLAAKTMQEMDHEAEDMAILKVLSMESILLKFIATEQKHLGHVQKMITTKHPDFQDFVQRDDYLEAEKTRILEAVSQQQTLDPQSPALKVLQKCLHLWTESETGVHEAIAESVMASAKSQATPPDATFTFGELPAEPDFSNEWQFDSQATESVNKNLNTSKPQPSHLVPIVSAIQPDSRPDYHKTPQLSPKRQTVALADYQFHFGHLDPNPFQTNWEFFSGFTFDPVRPTTLNIEWGFSLTEVNQPTLFFHHQDSAVSPGQHSTNPRQKSPTTLGEPFTFGNINQDQTTPFTQEWHFTTSRSKASNFNPNVSPQKPFPMGELPESTFYTNWGFTAPNERILAKSEHIIIKIPYHSGLQSTRKPTTSQME